MRRPCEAPRLAANTTTTMPALTPAIQVNNAVAAARGALAPWAATPLDDRIAALSRFVAQLEQHRQSLAQCISRETGKPLWESLAEVALMIAKLPVSIQAYHQRCATLDVPLGASPQARPCSSSSLAGINPLPHPNQPTAQARFRPHGVVAVFGPFNMPGHIPNGHITPALLAGNTVIFKPSEKTPAVAQLTLELWQAAGLPPGVINLLQGGRDTGVALCQHPGIDGIFFTGGTAAGLAIRQALAKRPNAILALEMGGNNPLVVHEVSDLDAAALETIQSAYITAGQRCTCARRLIVPDGAGGDAFIQRLMKMIPRVRVGAWNDDPAPFMGPVISADAADQLLATQDDLLKRGAHALAPMQRLALGPAFLSPGLIDVTAIPDRRDEEHFGPLLQLIRVPDFDAAIVEANNTQFGLAAGLFCDDSTLWQRFYQHIRAGVINWNRQTTNASGKLPFGGTGHSGNHRPSGAFAADYCSYPVASLELGRLTTPSTWPTGIEKM
ncbi:MAG: succinylglutamate-semialdehyde dehydrogenase [Phycisphaeraceae bacterium]